MQGKTLSFMLRGPKDIVMVLRARLDPVKINRYEDGKGLYGVDKPRRMKSRTGSGQGVRGKNNVERKEDNQVVEVGWVQTRDNVQDFFKTRVNAEVLHVH